MDSNRRSQHRTRIRRAGNALKGRVVEALADGDHCDWDALLAALTDDIEQRLDETLQELQSEGRVRYSGRHGGYVLDE